MNFRVVTSLASIVVVLSIVAVASSQPGGPSSELPALGADTVASTAPSTQSMDADREQIWNSPTMLRARAWVHEYCQRSARISPAEAQEYMTELSRLSPKQMKLWLLKFDAEEEMIRQQQAAFNSSRQSGIDAAMGVQRQAQQAYADFNQEETTAAQTEERALGAQQQLAGERGLQNAQDRDSLSQAMYSQPMYFGGYPYGGYAPYGGLGEYHVHFHSHR